MSQIRTDEREVDLVVQFREEDRRTLEQLKNAAGLRPPPGACRSGRWPTSPSSSGPSTIERENRRPEIDVTANTSLGATSFAMMGEVSQIMASIELPPGYEWSFGRWVRYAQQDLEAAGWPSGSRSSSST